MAQQLNVDAEARRRSASVLASLGIGPSGELLVPASLQTALASSSFNRRQRPRSAAPVEYHSSLHVVAPQHARPYYKAVAMEVNGGDVKFKSIYDGETEYRIGSDLYQHMDEDDLRETCGGFYCYETAEEVFQAIVPSNSALRQAERVVLKCIGWGARRRFPNGKYAVEWLRPISFSPFPRDVFPLERPDSRRTLDQPVPGRPRPTGRPSRFQIENFALEEEIRQMEDRLEAARALRAR